MNGPSDYGSGLDPLHPFDLKYPHHKKRFMMNLKAKNNLWRYLTIVGLYIILVNAAVMFWISRTYAPKVFVSTILHSGDIYQRGIFSMPLSKKKGDFVLFTNKIKPAGIIEE
ncbi:MAG: hypothetical protein OXD32_06835 [Endozoicomonadaceae bacterium]|nr:hypothetical protein [Endozoicomonadaceae bacterium]MCY4329366.1 hypothetical protein [Endozoicomonadaceae bacterium]